MGTASLLAGAVCVHLKYWVDDLKCRQIKFSNFASQSDFDDQSVSDPVRVVMTLLTFTAKGCPGRFRRV